MNETLFNSVSGIKTHQFGLDSVANNIANVNTNGYRENIPEFKNLFSAKLDHLNANTITNNDRSYGATAASNAISTKSGNYHASDGDFDMAYMGKGWFVVGPQQNGSFAINDDGYEAEQPVFFTRNGSFNRDADGYLVTSGGHYVYGVNLGKINEGVFTSANDEDSDLAALPTGKMQPLQIPQDIRFQPVLTTRVNMAINLNPRTNFKDAQEFLRTGNEINANRILDQDVASFSDNDGVPFDPRAFRDIILTIKKGKQEEHYRFSYGTGGVEANEFHSIRDLVGLFEKAGLILEPTSGTRENIALSVANTSQDSIQVTIGGTLASRIGINTSTIDLAQNATIQSKDLKIATYSAATDIYDEDGQKFLLVSDFYLVDSGDFSANPPLHQRWMVKSAIYDHSGELMVSENEVEHELDFDEGGRALAREVELDFKGNTITYDLTKSKHYFTRNMLFEDSKLIDVDQDGRAQGELKNVRIDENGIIFLAFSNGVNEPMGRVGIAAFSNDQGLKKHGDNLFSIERNGTTNTAPSGNPILGWNEKGDLRFGQIKYKLLETSNVDVGNALTNLVLFQRGYSMNAKAFSTGDDLIKEAIALKK